MIGDAASVVLLAFSLISEVACVCVRGGESSLVVNNELSLGCAHLRMVNFLNENGLNN